MVAAFYDAIMTDPNKAEQTDQLRWPDAPAIFHVILDSFVMPCRKGLRIFPVSISGKGKSENSNGAENNDINPVTMEAFNYFLLRHVVRSRSSWGSYAYPMEWITTFGSFFLLVVALLRVWST